MVFLLNNDSKHLLCKLSSKDFVFTNSKRNRKIPVIIKERTSDGHNNHATEKLAPSKMTRKTPSLGKMRLQIFSVIGRLCVLTPESCLRFNKGSGSMGASSESASPKPGIGH